VENTGNTGGTLTVTDTVDITLLGQYSAGSFTAAADDTIGTVLTYKDHLVGAT
jgi:large repetitive protein